jgi:hypothetical protein
MAKTEKGRPTSGSRSTKSPGAAKKVTGTVLKIVNGKPTTIKLSAERAFTDIDQARAQVLYVEKKGTAEEKRLVRLAFRQYQSLTTRYP